MIEISPQVTKYNCKSNFIACNQLHIAPDQATPSGSVAYYLEASQSAATRKGYASDVREYLALGSSLPATPADVAEYLASSTHLSLATLKRRLAALADVHASAGFADPTKSPVIRKLLRGIARVHGAASASAAPLRADDLARVVAAIPSDLGGIRDKALLLVGFACALRRSELVALHVNDVSLADGRSTLVVRRSKSDQFGRGRQLALPRLDGPLCPVAALKGWLTAARIESGPVFRAINRWKQVGTAALSSATVRDVVRLRAKNAGIAIDGLSAHSLRSGFAVSALDAGMSLPAVQAVTRHQTLGGVAAYVRSVVPASMAEIPARAASGETTLR